MDVVPGRRWRLPASLTTPRRADRGWRFTEHRYPEANAREWQVELGNPDPVDSPIHTHLVSADFVISLSEAVPVTLHWSRGSHAEASDFEPREDPLPAGKSVVLESFGGRSSDGVMPYFNLATPTGGWILAVGWSGDWRATFERLADGRVRLRAGLKNAHFRLHPRESVRLPSLLVMGYEGSVEAGQNQFRGLLRRRFSPPGRLPVAASVHGMIGFNDTTQENLMGLASTLAAARLPLDTFWLDAGWTAGGFPKGQGTWEPDRSRFPAGLPPVGVAARAAGMRFLAWFEPERAMEGSWLARTHPDWLLRPTFTPPELRYQEKDGFRLLNLGQPPVRQWAVAEISRQIREAGIAIYRQDCNLYPAYFWATDEPEDRQGLSEVNYVAGLYQFLDELRSANPGLDIDNCASGGRRLDFEMLRRSWVLWRSDSCWGTPEFPRNVQAMSLGLSRWIPLHGLGAAATDGVALRSGMGSCASFAINYADPASVQALREHLARYLPVRSCFAGDFHPLTDWSLDPRRWLVWEYRDPGADRGVVQAFAGPSAPSHFRVLPRGLVPQARYRIQDWDHPGDPVIRRGSELMTDGWTAEKGDRNAARVWTFERVR